MSKTLQQIYFLILFSPVLLTGQNLNFRNLNTFTVDFPHGIVSPQPLGDLNNDGVPELITSYMGSDSLYLIYLDENLEMSQMKPIDLNTIYTNDTSSNWKNNFRILGDLDNDGISEVVVSNPQINSGEVCILFLNHNGEVKDYNIIDPYAGDMPFYSELSSADYFGQGIFPIGDIDNDNVPDIIIVGWSEMTCDSMSYNHQITYDEFSDTIYKVSENCILKNDSALPVLFIVKLNSDGSVKSYHSLIENVASYWVDVFGNVTMYEEYPLSPGSIHNIGDVDGNGAIDLFIIEEKNEFDYYDEGWHVLFFNEDYTVKSKVYQASKPFGMWLRTREYYENFTVIPDLNMDGVREVLLSDPVGQIGNSIDYEAKLNIAYFDTTGELDKLEALLKDSIVDWENNTYQSFLFGLSITHLGDINSDGFSEVLALSRGFTEPFVYDNVLSIISIYPDSCSEIDCVWPGEANLDGVVNTKDILQIGSVFNQTSDKKRVMATTEWVEQSCQDWELNKFNVNAKHSDSDGNGVINFSDSEVIKKNYSKVSLKMDENISTDPSGPPLFISLKKDTVSQSDSIVYDIYFGDSEMPVENLFGMSIKLQHEIAEVFGSDNLANFNGSWLGVENEDMIAVEIPLEDGIDIGISRIDQTNRSGEGFLFSVKFLSSGNLEGVQTDFNLRITDLLIISFEGDTIIPNIVYTDPVIVFNKKEPDLNTLEKNLIIYPNPSSGVLNIESRLQLDEIRIVDLSGRSIYEKKNPSRYEVMNISDFQKGLYVLEFQSGDLVAHKQVFMN